MMVEVAGKIRVIEGARPDTFPLGELLQSGKPAVLKGLESGWGLVRAGLESDAQARRYLASFYNGKPVDFSFGDPDVAGRPFYNDDFTKLNFTVRRERLDNILTEIESHLEDERPPTYYVASLVVDPCMPGFRKDNDLGFAAHGVNPPPSIWIGNRTTASCHYDAPNNIACVAVGRRRFTLFPPEQIFNLYPGPLDPSPGGQAVSIVDFAKPDFARSRVSARWPRGRAPSSSRATRSRAEHVVASRRGLSAYNTLVNYWWMSMPSYVPTPMDTLYHAMWTLRDRPEREKQAWRNVFEYYVFGAPQGAGEHLPEQARGLLGPIDGRQARQLRAMLMSKLNR
jgi:hypothetical protein